MKKTLAALALGLAALPLLAGSAFAHGCHREVGEGRAGLHYHSRGCERIAVEQHRRYEHRDHHRRYEHREHRRHEPVCKKKCHYIGPFKECKTVCE